MCYAWFHIDWGYPQPGIAYRGQGGDDRVEDEDDAAYYDKETAEMGLESGGPQKNTQSGNSKTRIRTEFPETWLWADYVAE